MEEEPETSGSNAAGPSSSTPTSSSSFVLEDPSSSSMKTVSESAGGGGGDRKRLFSKELRCMMYGFGDDQNPYTESVDFLEDIVIEFISEVTKNAMEVGRAGRVQVEDIMHIVRKDPRKYSRVKDLLRVNEELKKARSIILDKEFCKF